MAIFGRSNIYKGLVFLEINPEENYINGRKKPRRIFAEMVFKFVNCIIFYQNKSCVATYKFLAEQT